MILDPICRPSFDDHPHRLVDQVVQIVAMGNQR